jgi:hypothetical protein
MNTTLKVELIRSGLRHRDVAEKCGCRENDVSLWVTGRKLPSPEQQRILSEFLGWPTCQLFPRGGAK